MNRVSIGTWAYSVGPYANNPVPFGEVVKGLKAMGFDGLELGAFGAHPTPDNHPTKESRQTLRDLESPTASCSRASPATCGARSS